MSTALANVIRSLRQPEYTGENRCLPCTAVNVAIAVVTAAVVALAAPVDTTGTGLLAGTVFVAAMVLIYLRGYLVPGTPWFTKTYFPDWLLGYFDHAPPAPDADSAIDPAVLLEDAGVVSECEDVDDLCLDEDFRAAWRDRIDERRGSDATHDDLATVLALPREALTLRDRGAAFVAVADAEYVDNPASAGALRVGQWESEGAFLADMAAAGVLAERVPDWSGLSPIDRGRVLNGIRVFLDNCPTCGGPLEFGEETVESCCRSREVVAITCTDCGDRLFEAEQPAAA